MKTKWYFYALIVVFIFLGAFQENTTVPNQEIVLEFVDVKIAKKDIDNTISFVKEKLQNAGAKNIEVKEAKNGILKISYYSLENIDSIKETLSKDNSLAFNNSSNHKEENSPLSHKSSNYNIDVYELDDYPTDISNFDGNSILEIKFDSRRYTNTQNFASLESSQISEAHKVFKTAYKINKSLLILKDNTSHLKPEVRAGPNS